MVPSSKFVNRGAGEVSRSIYKLISINGLQQELFPDIDLGRRQSIPMPETI